MIATLFFNLKYSKIVDINRNLQYAMQFFHNYKFFNLLRTWWLLQFHWNNHADLFSCLFSPPPFFTLKVTEQQLHEDLPLATSLSLQTYSDYDAHPVDHESASAKLAGRAPRFEDASGHSNVTVQLGGTAFLNCRVMDLQDKTVRSFHPLFHIF